MRIRKSLAVLGVLAGLLVATTWAADLFLRGPRTLDKVLAATSRVGAAGNTAAWIEAPVGESPVLAVRDLDSVTTVREPISDIAPVIAESPLGWLLDGPEVSMGCSGTCVRVAFVGRTDVDSFTLFTWSTSSSAWTNTTSSSPLFGVALYGDEAFVSRDGPTGADIYRIDLNAGSAMIPFVAEPGNSVMPAASAGWVAWLDQPEPPPPSPGVARLMAKPRTGGTAIEVAAESWLVDPMIEGDRLMWVGPFGQGAALHVTDLVTGDDGVLASDPRACRGCLPSEVVRGDLSQELLAHAGLDQMLHVYDARAVTSLGNLGSYLTPFTSVRTTTGSAKPAVDQAKVLWSEPIASGARSGQDSGTGSLAAHAEDPAALEQPDPSAGALIRELEVQRGMIFLPIASTPG